MAGDRQIQTHIPRLCMCDRPINFPIHGAMGWRFLRFPEMFFSQDPEFRGFCLGRLFGQTLFQR